MTVAELRAELRAFEDDAEVMLRSYTGGKIESVRHVDPNGHDSTGKQLCLIVGKQYRE